MRKNIPMICLIVATVISTALILNVDKVKLLASDQNSNVFLKEVRKPDGSGYIFDVDESLNLSIDD